MWRGLVLLCPSLTTAELFPQPPVVTAVQKEVFAAQAAKAKHASAAATDGVIKLFDSEAFREGLKKCCPEAAKLSSRDLLDQFREEVRAAELAHTFPSSKGRKEQIFHDVTIEIVQEYSWFLNEWQAPMLSNSSGNEGFSAAEVDIFGCKPFANPAHPTWKEASDRLIYVANNFRQLDTGNVPTFGDIGAIFKRSYLEDTVLMAPVDTGLFEMSCKSPHRHNSSLHMDCEAWNPQLVGTLANFDHIIIPNLAVWRKQFNTTVEEEAVKLFSRNSAFAGDYLKLPQVESLDAMKYYETNVLANPRFPDGVSFLIGNFHTLFGTDAGRQLQLLAMHYGWPLLWGLGGTDDFAQASRKQTLLSMQSGRPGSSLPGNQRILDPIAMAAHTLNVTIQRNAESAFTQLWAQMEQRFNQSAPVRQEEWTQWWHSLALSQIRLSPTTAKSGCSQDLCVGYNAVSKECVCRSQKTVVI